ncbi:MAG: IS1595 family transposase [Boseongicola sp. SB0662_bin_57]|nr:IS1595 family transposase [Boseongicola sp. SB0662_bin_57]
MTRNASGRSHREGMTVAQLRKMFPDNDTAEKWLEEQRWPDGKRHCPDCGSVNHLVVKTRKPMPYRCRDCRAYFSVRKGTAMDSSKIGFQNWAIAFCMMTTGIKGTSSMKLYRELGIRQATAWFLVQRLREGFMGGLDKPFPGPVEVDETAVGGKRKNMCGKKRLAGRRCAGKAIAAGVKDMETKKGGAAVVDRTNAKVLQGFVKDCVEETATACRGIAHEHDGMPRNAGEHVRGEVHTNGMEGFWSLFNRVYHGAFHHLSRNQLDRRASASTGRNNVRDVGTLDQIAFFARGIVGKRIRFRELVT